MPIERRPANPIPKGPRPGSRSPPHRVADNETFETVARRYGVTVQQLLLHNFGTTNPEELNWYLREYVGCRLETHDRRNWRFSTAAMPGLIYIPQAAIQMEPMEIVGGVPRAAVDLTAPGTPTMLATQKFVHEFKIPPNDPATLGYLLLQAKIAVEGELKQPTGWLKGSLQKDKIKLAIEGKITNDTKVTFGMKFDEKSLQPVADAIAKGSRDGLIRALASPFETSIKTSYRWGRLSVVPEAGLEASTTPLVIRVAGEFEDSLMYEGAPIKGKFVVKVGFNIGLSAAGWKWVAQRVGPHVLKEFLAKGGRALAVVGEWLLSEGVLMAGGIALGTIVGTFGLTYLMAWVVEDAHRKGALTGLATWYASGYIAKVFGEVRPSGFIIGDVQMRDQLVLLGERDAISDARAALGRINNPAAGGLERQMLEAFRDLLLAENQGNYYNTKQKIRLGLEEKSKKLVGL